jgi:hypothetical protein
MQLSRVLVITASIVCSSGAGGVSRGDGVDDAGDPSQWPAIALARALTAAASVDDPYRRAEAFASIARAQVVAAEPTSADAAIHEALSAAQQVAESAFRGWVLQDIVEAQIAADDFIGARATAERIEATRPQGAALALLARTQIQRGDLAAALQTTRKIRDTAAADEVLREIVAIQAAHGNIKAARETLRAIDDKFFVALAMADIAVAELRRGNIEAADALAARAPRAHRSQVYGRLALARFNAADPASATKSLQKIDDPLHRAAIQGRMAAERALVGDPTASEWFAEAIELASGADQSRHRAMTLAQLGRLQAISGEGDAASETLARARVEAGKLMRGEERNEALDYIARGQARAGHAKAALETAAEIDDRITRALLVRDVITLQSDVTSAAASATAAGFDDPLIETAAQFGVLGVELLKSGQPLSHETIDAARLAVRRIDDIQLKPAAFSALAAARIRSGDIEASRSIFEEALGAAEVISRDDQRAAAYVRVVNALNDRLVFLGKPASGLPESERERAEPH